MIRKKTDLNAHLDIPAFVCVCVFYTYKIRPGSICANSFTITITEITGAGLREMF